MITYQTVIINFNEGKDTSMVYSSKVKGAIIVENINTGATRTVECNEKRDDIIKEIKETIKEFNDDGFQVMSISNSSPRGGYSGLNLNSTIVMSKEVRKRSVREL